MILPAANYDTEWPNDHEFFTELSILKENLGTILVAATIRLSETDGDAGFQPIDYFVCGEMGGKPLSAIVSNLDGR